MRAYPLFIVHFRIFFRTIQTKETSSFSVDMEVVIASSNWTFLDVVGLVWILGIVFIRHLFFLVFNLSWRLFLYGEENSHAENFPSFLQQFNSAIIAPCSDFQLIIGVLMRWNRGGGCAQMPWHLPYGWGENPGKSQLVDSLIKAVRPVIASNDVSRIAQHARKREGRNEHIYILPLCCKPATDLFCMFEGTV